MEIRSTFRNHFGVVMSYGERRRNGPAPCWLGSKPLGWDVGKSASGNPGGEWDPVARQGNGPARLPRKTSMPDIEVTVPQTDTGRRGEYP